MLGAEGVSSWPGVRRVGGSVKRLTVMMCLLFDDCVLCTAKNRRGVAVKGWMSSYLQVSKVMTVNPKVVRLDDEAVVGLGDMVMNLRHIPVRRKERQWCSGSIIYLMSGEMVAHKIFYTAAFL